MKQISNAKIAINVILLSAIMVSCGQVVAWINTPSNKTESTQVAIVEERKMDTAPKVKEYAVPYGDTSFKSYMSYRAITNTESAQWALQKKCTTDDNGLRKCGDDYVIAVGSYYSKHIGERFRITLDTGESFTAVVGDFKADVHTDNSHKYTPMSDGRKNVVEFVVDTKKLNAKAKKMGDISYISGFGGNVVSVEKETHD